jgi:DNA-directed RNA polymerase II subunit RPB2
MTLNYSKKELSQEKKIFDLLGKYFDEKNSAEFQLNSYNELITSSLQKIIDDVPSIVVHPKETSTYTVNFGQIYVEPPCIIEENRAIRPILPQEARMRDLTYESSIFIDITDELIDTADPSDNRVGNYTRFLLCKIPTMVKSMMCNLYNKSKQECVESGECEYDPGGYFIINGKERVLIAQERANYNSIYVFEQKNNAKYKYVAEIRSMSEETGHSILIQCMISNDGKNVLLSLPHIDTEINFAIVFRAFGLTDEEIMNLLCDDRENEDIENNIKLIVMYNIHLTSTIQTTDDALAYIGGYSHHTIEPIKRAPYAFQVLENELFPHLGVSSPKEKILLLSLMIRKLIISYIYRSTTMVSEDNLSYVSDRDNLSMKRFESSGSLIAEVFRMLLRRTLSKAEKSVLKRPDIITCLSQNGKSITAGMRRCFSTGDWGIQKNKYNRAGVSQVLNRLSFSAVLSHLRRVVIQTGKERKNTKICQQHPTQMFFFCACESPEGHQIGIVKNFAMLVKISPHISTTVIRDVIEKMEDVIVPNKVEISEWNSYTKIMVNGTLVGVTKNSRKTLTSLRNMRRQFTLPSTVSITLIDDDNTIEIYSDSGRLLRPLFPVVNQSLRLELMAGLTWDECVERNLVVYRDSNEVEYSLIAMYPSDIEKNKEWEYDYCEIHPSLMFGVIGSTIPYPEHSQAPRNYYMCSQAKQSLSSFALSYPIRTDTVAHVMHYLEKPLIHTHQSSWLKYDEMPQGTNIMVAVMCYTGYNQEDSVILNKGAIDRGLFSCSTFKTFACEEKKKSSVYFETIEIPKSDKVRVKKYNYFKLKENGVIKEGVSVKENDVLISKVYTHIFKEGEEEKKDKSLVVKKGEEGIVDKVFETISGNGFRLIKIKIRSQRTPEIGDKFCFRNGQKFTCGAILPEEDMPRTDTGLVPDALINPHCLSGRMTINMQIEIAKAKVCLQSGKDGMCTAFSSYSLDPAPKICEKMAEFGFEKYGTEIMYSGITGEEIESRIFFGSSYCLRLRHLVSDKIHSRNYTGAVQMMTLQPSEGKSRGGGVRLGEMEKDCLISHGVALFMLERLLDQSDKYHLSVCAKCGNITYSDTCKLCSNTASVEVHIPYACKLLLQELNAINIKTNIMPKTEFMGSNTFVKKVIHPNPPLHPKSGGDRKPSLFKQEIRRKSEENKKTLQRHIEEKAIHI